MKTAALLLPLLLSIACVETSTEELTEIPAEVEARTTETVQILRNGQPWCSAVLLSARTVLTAGHCTTKGGNLTVDGVAVVSVKTPSFEQAELTLAADLPEPYATLGGGTDRGVRAFLRGYGCTGEMEERALVSETRNGDHPGLDSYRGRSCPGDSGAGVFAEDDGRLLGIVSTVSTTHTGATRVSR